MIYRISSYHWGIKGTSIHFGLSHKNFTCQWKLHKDVYGDLVCLSFWRLFLHYER